MYGCIDIAVLCIGIAVRVQVNSKSLLIYDLCYYYVFDYSKVSHTYGENTLRGDNIRRWNITQVKKPESVG